MIETGLEFRRPSLDRLGLGTEVLAIANPRLVRASVSAYGHGGGAE